MSNNDKNKQETEGTFDLKGSLVQELFETWEKKAPRFVEFVKGSCRQNSSFHCQIGDTWVKLYRSNKVVIQGPESQVNSLMKEALTDAPHLQACIEKLYEEHAGDRGAESRDSPVGKGQFEVDGDPPLESISPRSRLIVGGDEAGVGGSEYWAPMVFVMVAATSDQIHQLEKDPLIGDSKAPNIKGKREEAAKKAMAICPDWAVRVISPSEFNQRAPETEWHDFHIHAYLDCLRQLKTRPGADVRVDKIDLRNERLSRFSESVAHDFKAKLTMVQGGDATDPVIGAASCIASAIRDAALPRLREELRLLGTGLFDPAKAFNERSDDSFAKSEVRKFYEDRFGEAFLRERARVEKPMKS